VEIKIVAKQKDKTALHSSAILIRAYNSRFQPADGVTALPPGGAAIDVKRDRLGPAMSSS